MLRSLPSELKCDRSRADSLNPVPHPRLHDPMGGTDSVASADAALTASFTLRSAFLPKRWRKSRAVAGSEYQPRPSSASWRVCGAAATILGRIGIRHFRPGMIRKQFGLLRSSGRESWVTSLRPLVYFFGGNLSKAFFTAERMFLSRSRNSRTVSLQ